MSDSRPRTTVTKSINLAQLDREMGGIGLSAALDGTDAVVEVVAPEPVALADLQAAVDAHTAEAQPDPDDELDAALADAAAKPTVEEKVDATIAALRGQAGHAGRAAGRPA